MHTHARTGTHTLGICRMDFLRYHLAGKGTWVFSRASRRDSSRSTEYGVHSSMLVLDFKVTVYQPASNQPSCTDSPCWIGWRLEECRRGTRFCSPGGFFYLSAL